MINDVLVIVDMQNDFLLPDGKLFIGHDTAALAERVARFARDFDGEIFFTRDRHAPDDCEFKAFPEHCVEATSGARVIDIIERAAQGKLVQVFDKKTYTSTELSRAVVDAAFKAGGPATIFVTGIYTHICVADIAGDIVNTGKTLHNSVPPVVIYKDLVDDVSPEMAAYALRRLQTLYGVQVYETAPAKRVAGFC